MKWTILRLNMLPITAVEVQYACQALANLHNALVDASNKHSFVLSNDNKNIKPTFTSSSKFLHVNIQKTSNSQPGKMFNDSSPITYDKLFSDYMKLKQEIKTQADLLKIFYAKHSLDQSACLFHMLRLRLQRTLFDCNFQQNQTKKVMTKAQQQTKYVEIAKQFQSNKVQNQYSKTISERQFTESCDTFKTQNCNGYEDSLAEESQNEFLQMDNQKFQELNFQVNPQNKKPNQTNLKRDKSKTQKSLSPKQNNQQKINQNQFKFKIPIKKQPTSELTIATQNQHVKSKPILNLSKIQNDQNSFKNVKVLNNNNVTSKPTLKTQFTPKILNSTSSKHIPAAQQSNMGGKAINKNEKPKGYAALNQKKDEKRKNVINQHPSKKQIPVLNLENTKKDSFVKNKIQTISTQQKSLSPKRISNSGKKGVLNEPKQKSSIPAEKQKNSEKQTQDLNELLSSNGKQLRFTIKMSRQEYKSLLQLKSKMSSKPMS